MPIVEIASNVNLRDFGLVRLACSDLWIDPDDSDYVQLTSGDYYPIEDTHDCDSCCETCLTEDTQAVDDDSCVRFCCDGCAEDAGYYIADDGSYHSEPPDDLQSYYDSSSRIDRVTSGNPWLIGIEIEKEDIDKRVTVRGAANRLDWVATSDSSLDDDSGYELASPAYNLSKWDEIMRHLDSLADYINADATSNCGTHITISDCRYSNTQLCDRLGQFPALLALLYSRRADNSYSYFNRKSDCRHSRTSFINLTNPGRLEIRIFPRTKSVRQIKWRLRLVKWALEHQATPYLAPHLTNPDSSLYKLLAEVLPPERINQLARMLPSKAHQFDSDPNPSGRDKTVDWPSKHRRDLFASQWRQPKPVSPLQAYKEGLAAAGYQVVLNDTVPFRGAGCYRLRCGVKIALDRYRQVGASSSMRYRPYLHTELQGGFPPQFVWNEDGTITGIVGAAPRPEDFHLVECIWLDDPNQSPLTLTPLTDALSRRL